VAVHDAHSARTSNNLHNMMSRQFCGVHLCVLTNYIHMQNLRVCVFSSVSKVRLPVASA
jgi:hypothetical protein